jgi:hypothetical protein
MTYVELLHQRGSVAARVQGHLEPKAVAFVREKIYRAIH